jgi:hypothetical protein
MRKMSSAMLAAAMLLAAGLAWAGEKTYQVTGPVLELTDKTIVVQKGDEKWVINRDADTKVNGELKVGATVTIKYTMTATAVEVKPAK